MTIAVNDRMSGPFTATAGQTVFAFDFPAASDDELVVRRRRAGVEAVLVLDVDYTVARTESAGTITLNTGALAADQYLVHGVKAISRTAPFAGWRSLPPETIGNELDRLMAIAQEARRDIDAAFKVNPFTENFDAKGKRIANAAAAVDDGDVALMGQIRPFAEAAAASADAAAASAASAADSEATATAAADEADADAASCSIVLQLTEAAKDAAVAAAELSGNVVFFATKADATAGTGALAEGQIVQVISDEDQGGARSFYKKVSGSLVFMGLASTVYGTTVRDCAARPRGTIVYVGDSNTNGREGFEKAVRTEWHQARGRLEGWTRYNIGQNGSTLAGWTGSIDTGEQSKPPQDYYQVGWPTGSDDPNKTLWQAVNADPDLIVFSLGTNDEASPAGRASIGTLANIRFNLNKCITFLLQHCPRAGILLRLPAPFVHEDFSGITEWVDADEAAGASAILRTAYLEWSNRHPRVLVWDSHKTLFGLRCDNKATQSQDPEGQGALMSDSLHPTDLGFTRSVQHMSQLLFGSRRRTTETIVVPPVILSDSYWSRSVRLKDASNSGANTLLSIFLGQEELFISGFRSAALRRGPMSNSINLAAGIVVSPPTERLFDAEMAGLIGDNSVLRELLAIKGSFTIYCTQTGNSYTPTGITLSQVVTNPDGEKYAVLNILGVNMGSEPKDQTIIVYVTAKFGIPYRDKRRTSFQINGAGRGGAINMFGEDWAVGSYQIFRPNAGGTPTVTLYAQNQIDGRWVTGVTFSSPGMPLGTFTFPAGFVGIDFVADTNIAGGFTWQAGVRVCAQVTAGTLTDQATIVLEE